MFLKRRAALAVACVAIFATGFEASAKSHPYSPEFEQKVQQLFLDGTSIAPGKIDAYISRLQVKRAEVKSVLMGAERYKGKTDLQKIEAKAEAEGVLAAFDSAIRNLQAAKFTKDEAQFYAHVATALDLEGAVRIQGNTNVLPKILKYAGATLSTWTLPKNSSAEAEASNLYNHATKSYLSAQEIADLKARNVDLSLYSPGPSNYYLPQGNVARVDVRAAVNGRTVDIYDGFSGFPEENVFEYDGIKQSDTKPKMDVTFKNAQGKKQKLKLKFGAEIHADPTVSALMLTLGFPADMTKYVRNIKVILGKSTLSDLKRDWEVFYSREGLLRSYKIEKYIVESGVDDQGRNFVIFKEGLLEAKPEGVERIGGWKFGENGRTSLREVRALMFVQMWLDNNDVKEFDNNEVLLKVGANGETKHRMIISDLGRSLGGMLLEAPNLYSTDMIASETEEAFNFKFLSVQPVKIKNTITLSDARWATRLIAGLTRQQIATAVELAGWPQCMQQIYVDKMIARRNNLVQKLGLSSSISLLPLSTAVDKLRFDDVCEKDEVSEAYTSKFDPSMASMLKPVAGGIWMGLRTFAASAINGQRKIHLTHNEFGFNKQEIAEIILNARRDIERNPSPTSEKDLYIVKDQFEVGFRLGISYGVYKDVIYTRMFTLAYPVRTLAEGQYNNGFLVNLLLPLDIRNGNLPESYVLKTEHYLENGAGVDFDKKIAVVSPIIRAGVARINLWRSILDHRDTSKMVLYRDRSDFTEASLALLARVAIFKIPVFKALAGWGKATGRGSIFTKTDLATDSSKANAVVRAVTEGDFYDLQANEKEFDLTNEFSYRRKKWNLLIVKGSSEKRLDNIEMTSDGSSRTAIQFTTSKGSEGGLFSSTEQKSSTVEVFVDPKEPQKFRISVGILGNDAVTTDKELAKYIGFINGLSTNGSKVINFDAANGYTTNGVWGATVTKSDTEYSAQAIEKLLSLNEQTFWSHLGAAKGLSTTELQSLQSRYEEFVDARRNERSSVVNDRAILASLELTADQAEMIQEAKAFLKRLASAKKETRLEKKVKVLAEAFRKAVYVNSTGFYDASLLATFNHVAGEGAYYSRNLVTKPQFKEMNMIEGVPLFGEIGKPLEGEVKYLVFSPQTPVDLYTMFDSWF